QIATADGRWLALVTAEGRKVPQTDAERATALRTMISYTGRYRLEQGKVVTKVEAAWNEAWVGTEQVRAYRFEGDLLHLESPAAPREPAAAASPPRRPRGAGHRHRGAGEMKDAKYFLVVRFAIEPQAEAQVLRWLDGGHAAEVAGQPGFLWCRRLKGENHTY